MKFCENCGKELKDGEKFCFNCGYNIKRANKRRNPPNHQNLGIIISIISIFAFLFVAYNVLEKYETTPISEESQAKNIYNKYETLSCSNYDVTITEYRTLNNSQYAGIYDGEEFIAIYLTVTNTSESSTSFNEDNIKLINSNGEIIKSQNWVFTDMFEGTRINNFTLEKGGSKSGYIVFRNNNMNNDNLKAKLNCGFFGDEYTVNLNS